MSAACTCVSIYWKSPKFNLYYTETHRLLGTLSPRPHTWTPLGDCTLSLGILFFQKLAALELSEKISRWGKLLIVDVTLGAMLSFCSELVTSCFGLRISRAVHLVIMRVLLYFCISPLYCYTHNSYVENSAVMCQRNIGEFPSEYRGISPVWVVALHRYVT